MPAITVTILGAGNASYCYAIINGTKQYEAGTHEVKAGDTITFGVKGRNSVNTGYVKIDGTKVIEVTDTSTQTYDWTVPNGISTVKIRMNFASNTITGRIIVTTA